MPAAAVAPDQLPPYLPEETPRKQVDDALRRLQHAKGWWTRTTTQQRLDFLKVCLNGIQLEGKDWVRAACRGKGHAAGSSGEGEEWLAGPVTIARGIRLLMDAVAHERRPPLPEGRSGPGGRTILDVFPADRKEQVVFPDLRGEIWLPPGTAPSQGGQRGPAEGRVCAVLGAGNQTSIPPLDALYKLFVEDQVVLLKMNPVNAYAGPYISRAFWRLIEANLFTVVYGGAELGAALAAHPDVDTLHITGSVRTHDAIVWGADAAEQARRKARGEPRNPRPITSELGCVTPVIVMPGQWSDGALRQQARQAATMIAHNGGFNCNSAQVLITAAAWPQRAAFLGMVEESLAAIGTREAYYPGARGRWQAFLSQHPGARQIGTPGSEAELPWLLAEVSPEPGQPAFTQEAFCGVAAVTALPSASPADFAEEAARLCNDHLWGNLSAAVLHGEGTPEAAVEHAVTALRYGTVGVNVWPGVAFGLGVMPWGAYPGNRLDDVQSGLGTVHNTLLLDRFEKGVLRAPPVSRPDPVWLLDNPRSHRVGPPLVDFETHPRWRKLPRLALAALSPRDMMGLLRS